jgi:hypothetical protein
MAYNMSYMQLTDGMYVHFTPGTGRTHAQPSNDYDLQAPLSRGTVLSRLTAYFLDPEHCKQQIPFADRLKVFLWIDSNVPFYSHYRQVPPLALKADARKELRGVYERRCARCHDAWDRPDARSGLSQHHIARHVGGQAGQWGIARSGMRVRHLNLSHPAHSAALQAPLAKQAGGWGICQGKDGPIFCDGQDADYQEMLGALQNGVVSKTGILVQGVKELLHERKEMQSRVSLSTQGM